jgi:hypothetical protein
MEDDRMNKKLDRICKKLAMEMVKASTWGRWITERRVELSSRGRYLIAIYPGKKSVYRNVIKHGKHVYLFNNGSCPQLNGEL